MAFLSRKWIGYGFFAAFIAGLNWLLPILVRPSSAPVTNQEQIDEYMLQAKAVRYNDEGLIAEELNIEGLYHIQAQDYMTLKSPQLTLHRDALVWSVKADSGKSFHTKENSFERVELSNHVEVNIVKDSPDVWRMQTDSLTVYPAQEVATTDAPISIFSGQLLIEGVGLHSDLKLGQVHLKKEVTSYYEIPIGS